MIALENQILTVLEFDLTFPTCYRFIERFAKIASADDQVFYLACYLQELTIIDSEMKKWAPSRIAASSIYFAKKMLGRENPWCNLMFAHTGYTIKQVRECARDICIILNKTTKKKQNHLYKSITKKF